MPAPQKPTLQYSLSALLIAMLLVNLGLAYVSFVGLWGLCLAVVPPIVIAGVLRGVLWQLDLPGRPRREDLRVLGCLVAGFVIWLPILSALSLR